MKEVEYTTYKKELNQFAKDTTVRHGWVCEECGLMKEGLANQSCTNCGSGEIMAEATSKNGRKEWRIE